MRAPITEGAFGELLKEGPHGQVNGLHMPVMGAVLPDPNLVWAGAVMKRENGFMIVLPVAELVHQAVLDLVPSAPCPEPMFHQGEVQLSNTKGRDLGTCTAELVDLPWPYLENFSRSVQFRGAAAAQFKVLGFSAGGAAGKPVASSVEVLATEWFESMDPDTAQEYLTGEEFQEVPLDPAPPVDPDVVTQLQDRIAELESQLKQSAAPGPSQMPLVPGPKPTSVGRAQGLFQGPQGQTVSPQDWAKLKKLAGGAPPRVASVETRRPPATAALTNQENIYAEVEREAAEEELGHLLDPALRQASAQNMDPVQQILVAQLQQNQVLLQRLVGLKVQDPVLKALGGGGGSDSASGSSSSGVRGCLARDVFIKASADLPAVCGMVRAAALRELGMSPDREDGNLLRKYMERRVPLADHRQLALFATLVSEGWNIGYQSQNTELLGMMGKMMVFIEQCALDAGRSQFAWLLTGLQDPPMHMLVSQKRKPGMEPFSRLCSPSWISANLAYVKDLDYMESRMTSMTSGKAGKALAQEDGDAQPKAKPKTRPKGRGKGKGSQPAAESSAVEGS